MYAFWDDVMANPLVIPNYEHANDADVQPPHALEEDELLQVELRAERESQQVAEPKEQEANEDPEDVAEAKNHEDNEDDEDPSNPSNPFDPSNPDDHISQEKNIENTNHHNDND